MTKPLRIVMVLPEPPLPFGGAASRIYYVTQKGLVERGHRLTTFIASGSSEAKAEAHTLFPRGAYDLRFFLPPSPSLEASPRERLANRWHTLRRPMAHQFSPEFIGAVRSELGRGFDFLQLEDLWSAYVGLPFAAKAVLSSHCLQAIDLAGLRPTRWQERLYTAQCLRMEQKLLRAYPFQLTLSPELATGIAQLAPKARVKVVPLPLDLANYSYQPDAARPLVKRLALIGSFQWVPTKLAAERLITRLWPRILAAVPDAELELTGRDAGRLAANYALLGKVTINDSVKAIKPYFERASVLLYAPGQGSGMKVKVLESMALGVPVVTTRDGIEGLPEPSGEHPYVATAESDDDLVAAAVALLRSPARQNRQRLAARQVIERCCNPERILDELEAYYYQLLASREG